MMLRMTPIALATGTIWSLSPLLALAENVSATEGPATRLKEVTVTATRTERPVDNVPNTVSVFSNEDIEKKGSRDIKDLFGQEADVSVRMAPTRFTAAGAATGRAGTEGINIRGLEGNQVLMMIDGVRVPNGFSFGAFATGRGDFVALEGLKTVEILRGPASTQFGSDGLAGAVGFRTLDPQDLLGPQKKTGGFAKSAYSSVDRSWVNTVAAANQSGAWESLLLGSYRRGHETRNKGSNDALNIDRTTPNPETYSDRYFLGKLYFHINDQNQAGMIVESQRRNQSTSVYSARAKPPLTATSTVNLDTDDHTDRDRISFEHKFSDLNGLLVQRAETKLFWQSASTAQFSAEARNTVANRTRNNTYKTDVIGISSLAESNFSGWLNQRVSYGFEWSKSDISGVRDGTIPPYGEQFPVKPFPDTSYTLGGAFIQSEIETQALSVIPGLRFDYYKLSPSSAGYTGKLVALSDHAITPRIGLVWRLSPEFAPYAQWAKGFRAPTPDQVNNGFTNLASGYTSIGNPALKPELANSFEVGIRGQLNGIRLSLAAFDNRYDDFISQQVVGGAGTPSNPTIFQYINLSKAHIRGTEARAAWDINKLWGINAAIAYAKGDSDNKGVSTPIDTINPVKAVLGVRYTGNNWGIRSDITHSQGKKASQVGTVTASNGKEVPQYVPPSYTVLDASAYWKAAHSLTFNIALNNVFDTKYWVWSDVRGLADNSTIKDAYTAPGRNIRVSVRYDF